MTVKGYGSVKEPVKAVGDFVGTYLQHSRYENISATELSKLLASPEPPMVVDCRAPEDYEEGHIKEALNIPYFEFNDTFARIPVCPKVVTICYVGIFSRVAAQKLATNGYPCVLSSEGGMAKWTKDSGPIESE